VERLGRGPGLIKIDVEGTEWEVLKGAEGTLRAHRPDLLLSLHPEPLARIGVAESQILEWLAARGYVYEVIGRDHEIHMFCRSGDDPSSS